MATAHTGKGKSVAAQELRTAFADIMSCENTLKEKFQANFNSIVGAKTNGDQVTDVELESWGVTRELVEVATRKKELEVLGGIHKRSVWK